MREAHAVVVELPSDERSVALCAGVLDPDERARADRFLRVKDRIRFIGSHAALRLVLGRGLGRAPGALTFDRDANGRPRLARCGEGDLDFNLSHSGSLALIGTVRGARIGVDVEMCRPLPNALRIARSHFAPDEVSALAALPAATRESAFFALWTRKEAVVKAIGAGLSHPLSGFSVTVPPCPPKVLRIAGGCEAWFLAPVAVPPGAEATVAVDEAGARIVTTCLPPGWADNFDAN